MTSLRSQLDLHDYASKRTPSPAANDEDRMPPLWLAVTILIGYFAVIGVGLWAVVKAVLR